MILLIKRLFRTINTMNAINKIVDEKIKENEFLKNKCIEFRTRAIEAEQSNINLSQQLTDARIIRPNGIMG